MSGPEPGAKSPESDRPPWSAQPIYSNLGEVRAHLLPSKACRPRTPRSLSSAPQPPPPPLPKKTLARTQSLPTHRAPGPSSARAGQPRRPLQRSPSEDVSRATALTLDGPRAALGLSAHPLNSPEAVQAALAARQLDALRDIHARLRARLMGGRPGPCLPGHSFRLLDSLPCVESGEALYYRVVRVDGVAWHVLAAKHTRVPSLLGTTQGVLVLPSPVHVSTLQLSHEETPGTACLNVGPAPGRHLGL
ncbi:Hypothetical predicted protein [Marmota monax]|uniref:Uncharacterized protein n=1 Tax=Marmota monax TaxID=9995 RepID=A0A5E4BHS8_MARMO|nr:Hypothetical predicted protein [Marmota monax]